MRPRYKRLVDRVFTASDQDDGQYQFQLDILTVYTVGEPERLDCIGEYLYRKASRSLARKRHRSSVAVAVQIMDKLLSASDDLEFTQLVDWYLRMVQMLLLDEATDGAMMQVLAAKSV